MTFVQKVAINFNYLVAMVLFLIGLYTIIVKSNLIKKFMGFNIMETSVFLLFISLGTVREGKAPIITAAAQKDYMVNPLPQALILTGIVVAVSTTALALSLIIRIYQRHETLNAEKLRKME